MISVSGRRLAGLVDDLLDFSKLKHRGLELVLRPVGIHALTDIVLTMVKPLAEDKDLALVNEVDPDLPAAYADENRVHQILLNLVGNGIKFNRPQKQLSRSLNSRQVAGRHQQYESLAI